MHKRQQGPDWAGDVTAAQHCPDAGMVVARKGWQIK